LSSGRSRFVRFAPSPGFAWEPMRRFLAQRAIPSVEVVSPAGQVRTLRIAGEELVVECRFRPPGPGPKQVSLAAHPNIPNGRLRALGVRLFDLERDLGPYCRMAARDPVLRRLGRPSPSLRIPQFADPFEGLVRAILGQQVSLAAARTLAARLVALAGRPAPAWDGAALRLFPSAEAVAACGFDRLRDLGLTGAKARALHGCAVAVAGGAIPLAQLEALPLEEAERALTSLPGIGAWTASYVLMRAFARADAFPAADLGVRKALERALPRRRLTPGRIRDLAESWRPWRAYATFHLWRSLST